MKQPAKPIKPVKVEEGPIRAATMLEDRRRSQRVMVRMPVILHVAGRTRPVTGMTVAVSETGAMLVISESLTAGTKLSIENPKSQKSANATVTRTAQVTAEGAMLPIEFVEPAPAFWGIFFPPPGN